MWTEHVGLQLLRWLGAGTLLMVQAMVEKG